MKCQNCGKSEVNFHCSTNINGYITETHLCAECAEKEGYDFGRMFDENLAGSRNSFGSFFPIFGGQPGYSPLAIPVFGFGTPMTLRLQPQNEANPLAGSQECQDEGSCSCGKNGVNDTCNEVDIDIDMKTRRELRIQMHKAAQNEDYEKAAEIRDILKELEKHHEI